MESMTIILSVSLIVILIFLCISLYFNIKHAMIILRIQDALEESLDILDKQYSGINEILEIPVFFDSMEVRNVISRIKKSHDSVLYVANTLTASVTESEFIKNKADNES